MFMYSHKFFGLFKLKFNDFLFYILLKNEIIILTRSRTPNFLQLSTQNHFKLHTKFTNIQFKNICMVSLMTISIIWYFIRYTFSFIVHIFF